MTHNISPIIEAVASGEPDFSTLKGVDVVKSADGSLFCMAGGESVIFKVLMDGSAFALKCYATTKQDLKERYEQLAIWSRTSDVIPSMTYLEDELFIIDNYGVQKSIDVLLYRWVEGVTLLEAIERSVEFYDSANLLKLCRNFTLLARQLVALPVAHGDLKPQNILVGDDGNMCLVDYDMAFWNEMPCRERVCTQWYQHPMAESWDENYAIAVIVVSLFLLSLEPQLFYQYHNGENIIIDTQKATHGGVFNKEIDALLAPYPTYKSLFEIVAAPSPVNRDIVPLLANLFGAKSPSCRVVDEQGILRRIVCPDGLYGFVDSDENLVVGCSYGDATPFDSGVAGVCLNGSWYLLDGTGRSAVEDVYDEVGAPAEGLVPVSKNRRWHYLNASTLRRVGSADYDYAYSFSDGFGLVRDENSFYFVDTHGEHSWGGRTFRFARPFVNGYAIVAEEGYFVMDTQGRRISDVFKKQLLNYDGKYVYYREEGTVVRSKCLSKNIVG